MLRNLHDATDSGTLLFFTSDDVSMGRLVENMVKETENTEIPDLFFFPCPFPFEE